MSARQRLCVLVAAVWLMVAGVAIAESPQPESEIQGLERLTPEERATAERQLDRWRRMTPAERERARRNFEQWKRMTPEERAAARERFHRFRRMSPAERARVLADFERWNELPESRRQELEEAHRRFQDLPPERRERILERFHRFQSLPPEKRERVLRNWERWQRMPPEERKRIRERWQRMRDSSARRHEMERVALEVDEAPIRPEPPELDARGRESRLGGFHVGNAERHVMRLPRRLVAFGLKERELRAVSHVHHRHRLGVVADVEAEHVAEPGDGPVELAVTDADVIDSSAVD